MSVSFCFARGLALAALAGKPWAVFDAFLKTMGEGKIIGPICSAMGFAFVLKRTGCDRELVKLLLRPIRNVRWLLVPGGCAVGFLTNSAITSQTAAAAAVVDSAGYDCCGLASCHCRQPRRWGVRAEAIC